MDSAEDPEKNPSVLKRADQALVDLGLARSRAQANEMIKKKQVKLLSEGKWMVVVKPSQKVSSSLGCYDFEIESDLDRYVSRGGLKLEGALEHLKLDIKGKCILDLGLSTGGFADCLLQAGARQVLGVDVGHGQLDKSLRGDSRLVSLEGVNARDLEKETLENRFEERKIDLATMDLSFISLKLIFPALARVLPLGAHILALVKPQFEVGAGNLGKGGLVKDKALYQTVQTEIQSEALNHGFQSIDYFPSSIEGGDGNKEFFLFAEKTK